MEQLISGTLPEWAKRSGYGYGGNGYGNGYGGYGNGWGYGYGYGYGNGYGNGYGSGYGDGDGDGSGYGYGYGNGYGSGYGDGDGDGDGKYWLSTIQYFAQKWNAAQRKRLLNLSEAGATIAFWRSDKNGLPSNGGKAMKAAAPGVVHTAPGPLNLCCAGTLHATLLPLKWQGDRVWIVALTGKVIGDGEKYGALSREIIGEALYK